MKPTIKTALAVILLSTITRNLGYLRSEVTELITLTLFIVLLALTLPFRSPGSRAAGVVSAIALAALTIAFAAAGQTSRIVLVAAALSAAFLKRDAQARRGEGAALVLAVSLFGIYVLALKHSSVFWHLTDRAAKAYSHHAAELVSRDLLLGATAGGLHNSVLIAAVLLSFYIVSENRSRLLLFLTPVAPAALMGAFTVAGTAWKGSYRPGDMPYELNHLDLQLPLVLAGLAVIRLAAGSSKPRRLPAVPGARRVLLSLAGAAALFAAILILVVPPAQRDRGRTILLHDRGHVMWRRPVFGWYGDKSGGMFGNLPRYLEFRGFEARRDTISQESLRGADLVIAINPAYFFTEEEHRLTWEFVENGGALLALGDHTGRGSIREPFNSLLEPVGIEFEFDSAKGFSESWVDGMEWRPHETTRVIRDENSTQIWTGASLKLAPGASPLVLGKFAWSDSGDVHNSERSYLGDFKYNQGELLGDVVLVGAARHGKGKVLVFGDTSTFQNGALVQSDEYAHACLQWLCGEDGGGAPGPGRTILGLGVAVVAVALLSLGGLSGLGLFLLSMTILASPLSVAFTGQPPPRSGDPEEKVAYIDKAHVEWFDLNSWNKESIGGLTYNLMRNGFLAFVQRRFSEPRLDESDIMIASGPTRDFSPGEIEAIDRFVRSGNVLIASTGYSHYEIAPSLLGNFGFSVRNVPLGRLYTEGLGRPVRFYDAYPVDCAGPDTSVVCEGYGYPVAVMREVGEGRVLVMGDSRFFQNKNLEDRSEFVEENIMFVKALLEKLDREVPDQ